MGMHFLSTKLEKTVKSSCSYKYMHERIYYSLSQQLKVCVPSTVDSQDFIISRSGIPSMVDSQDFIISCSDSRLDPDLFRNFLKYMLICNAI